jgi:hypothetical protein
MLFKNLLENRSTSNTTQVTIALLEELKIPVTRTAIIQQLEYHPDFPSLYSISDSLKKWNVDNIALQTEYKNLEELPVPFIAHTKKGGGNFILVHSINGSINYIDEKGKLRKKSREDFHKEWDNIVLLAEKQEGSGDKNYGIDRKKEILNSLRIPTILAGSLLLVILYYLVSQSIILSSLLLLKFLGSIVTGLLLWFEIDKSNPILKQFCSTGSKANCTAILGSKQAKLLNVASWSEIGFFYFSGGFIFLLLIPDGLLAGLTFLGIINALALPYVVFSIIYQWRIAKQWCPLCLAVQALLLLEFAIFFFSSWNTNNFAFYFKNVGRTDAEWLILISSFLLPVFFWILSKKTYLVAQDAKQFNKELNRLKYDKVIFHALLSKQNQLKNSPDSLGIILGNPDAKNTIIKVCNPYCGPCARAHLILEEILKNNNDVKVQIIFTATNDEGDIRAAPVKHFMALLEKKDKVAVESALRYWYNSLDKDYELFATKFPLKNDDLEKVGLKIEKMSQWCKQMKIAITPTVFLNGYQLPGIYNVNDLKFLIE